MAMPDRRNAPIFAAAAAFVLVLAFGKLFSTKPASPIPNPSASATATPTASSSSPSPTAQQSTTGGISGTVPTPTARTKLTVQAIVSVGAAGGVPIADVPVEVAQAKRNGAIVAQNILAPEGVQDTNFMWTMYLAPATYQVCIQPPTGTRVASPDNTDAQPGWSCTKFRLVPGSAPVTFDLVRGSG